jgi:hypothetical protein
MDNSNAFISGKILLIKRRNMSDAMDLHRRHKTSIVDLDADYGMCDHQPTPLGVYSFIVGQEGKAIFNQFGAPIGLGSAQSVTILRWRPRANIPKLSQVLRCKAERRSGRSQRMKGSADHGITGVATL